MSGHDIMGASDIDDIDRAIDEAANALTAGDPGAAFRARLMDRLTERRRPRRMLPWTLSAAAIAAAIVAAVMVGRPAGPREHAGDTQPALLSSRSLATGASAGARTPDATAGVRPPEAGAGAPITRTAGRRPEGATARGLDSTIGAPAPDRLEVEPIETPSIALDRLDQPEALTMPELEPVEPIVIAPIGIPEGERQ
jgi:hypothetical protein